VKTEGLDSAADEPIRAFVAPETKPGNKTDFSASLRQKTGLAHMPREEPARSKRNDKANSRDWRPGFLLERLQVFAMTTPPAAGSRDQSMASV
jgi:hypothetical protein